LAQDEREGKIVWKKGINALRVKWCIRKKFYDIIENDLSNLVPEVPTASSCIVNVHVPFILMPHLRPSLYKDYKHALTPFHV